MYLRALNFNQIPFGGYLFTTPRINAGFFQAPLTLGTSFNLPLTLLFCLSLFPSASVPLQLNILRNILQCNRRFMATTKFLVKYNFDLSARKSRLKHANLKFITPRSSSGSSRAALMH